MIEGIVGSLAATLITAVAVYLWKSGHIEEWRDVIVERVYRHAPPARSATELIPRFRRRLVRQLVRDQSRSGVHFGEFGRSTSFAESAKYQRNPEDLSVKPRMYLTFWPGVVLQAHRLAPRAVRLATKGVQQLYDEGCILVHQPISSGSLPQRQTRLISYRHTICGAYFLHVQLGWNKTTRAVLDRMLDRQNKWQNDDGGWSHSNKGVVDSDLWGSAYAFRLLDAAIRHCGEHVDAAQLELARTAQQCTVRFLAESWSQDRWAYGGASSEENAVSLFIEVAEALPYYDQGLFQDVITQLQSWLRDITES